MAQRQLGRTDNGDDGVTVVAVILARGGSKRLPRKNVLPCGGRPLIAWSIAVAHAARGISRVIVSSDDDEILQVARDEGCEVVKRPAELASDDSSSISALFHVLDGLDAPYTHVVLLQPTSPLRITEDVEACLVECREKGAPACVAVTNAPVLHTPIYGMGANGTLVAKGGAHSGLAAQDLSAGYVLNGAVYVADIEWLRRTETFVAEGTRAYVMPPDRSVDIDRPWDFMLAELILMARQKPDH